jgi:hypothetical protein
MTNKKEKKQKKHTRKTQSIHPSDTSRADGKKVFGLLVLLGFDVTAFTPAAYQGHRL